jgi:uncharacterized protein
MSGRPIRITAGRVSAAGRLGDSPTATAIWDALPIEAGAQTWGDEIYFGIDVDVRPGKRARGAPSGAAGGGSAAIGRETGPAGAEITREIVELGDLGYWPPGQAFCIFFGPTPASRGDEIRPASAVHVVGRISGDPKVFKQVSAGATVRIERA